MSWKEQIDAARAARLAVLQPTAARLKRGLALHGESLGCESYGLGLRAPADGEALAAAAAAGASESELALMGATMAMTRWAHDDELRAEYLGAWEASGVTCTFQNAGEEGNAPLRMLERLAHYTHLTDRMGDQVRRAATPDDIEAAAPGRGALPVPDLQRRAPGGRAGLGGAGAAVRARLPRAGLPHDAPDLQPAEPDRGWLRRGGERGPERLRARGGGGDQPGGGRPVWRRRGRRAGRSCRATPPATA